MSDFSQMSDEELLQKYQDSKAAQPSNDYGSMSDADLLALHQQNQEPEGISKTESALRGAAQGASAGFQDEISPLFERGFAKLFGDQNVSDLYEGKTYKDLRDTYRAQNANAERANPNSYLGGQLTGMAPLAIATGGKGIIGNAVSNGALAGVNTVGETTSEDPLEISKQAALSAGLGSLLGAGFAAAPKLASPLANKFTDIGQKTAVRALGRTKKITDQLQKSGRLNEFGQKALDSGLVGWFQTPAKTAEKTAALLEQRGTQIGALDQEAQGAIADLLKERPELASSLSPSGADLSQELRDAVVSPMSIERGQQAVSKNIDNWLTGEVEAVRPQDPMSLQELRKLKGSIREKVNYYGNPINQDASNQAGFNKLSQGVEQKMGDIYGKLGEESGLPIEDVYKQANKDFGFAKTADDLAQDTIGRIDRNNFIGLGDYAVGGSITAGDIGAHGLSKGAALKGLGGALGAKYVRQMAPAFAANAFTSMGNLLKSDPARLGKYAPAIARAVSRGPQEFAVTNYVLSETDPNYRQLRDEIHSESQ